MSGHAFFDWIDAHPEGYSALLVLVLVAAGALALRPWLRPGPAESPRPDWRWGLVLLLILFAGRWPSVIIPRELNPDESQVFATTHALAHDPILWRSVDSATSGPLNFFVLLPAGLAFGWDSYPGIRLTAVLLLALSLTLVHQCLAFVYPPRMVRLATFSAATFEALTSSVDLLHCSTELLSMVWLGAAGYAALRRWARQGGPAWCGLGGLMLGAVPMSKLQAAPLALVAGLYWVWSEWRAGPASRRHLVYLIAGALLPSIFFVVPVVLAGHWDSFFTAFIVFNFSYTAAGETSLPSLFGSLLGESLKDDSLLHVWLPATILWCALAFRVRAFADRAARTFTLLALAATLISVFCVLRAGRPFIHYWQLVIPPVTLLLGALLGNLTIGPTGVARFERWLVATCALVLLGGSGAHRVQAGNPFLGASAYFAAHPRNPLSDHILAHARPGEAIAIWGWSNYVYIETGLRQATHDAHSEWLLRPNPLLVFFRERFLVDLMVTRPAIFLDSIGRCSIAFRAPELRHDRSYPGLAEFIKKEYLLVDEFDGARIYRRRDLAR